MYTSIDITRSGLMKKGVWYQNSNRFFFINLQMFYTVVLYLLFGMVIWLSVANCFFQIFLLFMTLTKFFWTCIYSEKRQRNCQVFQIYTDGFLSVIFLKISTIISIRHTKQNQQQSYPKIAGSTLQTLPATRNQN